MNPWTQTYTGIAFDLLEPHPSMVCLEDVMHSLAKMDRYNGHAVISYPVAQHSILVAKLVQAWGGTEAEIFDALTHDAIETYIGDMISPMKRAMRAALAEKLRLHPAVYPDTLPQESAFLVLAKELEPFAVVEYRVEIVVREALDMLPEQPDIVTKADLTILANERETIMAPCDRDWELPHPPSTMLVPGDFEERDWRFWKRRFHEEYERLRPR